MSEIENKSSVRLSIEPITQGVSKFKIQNDAKGINHSCIYSAGSLVKSVLNELGISSALIISPVSTELLESNSAVDVLIIVANVENEDVPQVHVFSPGGRIGGFSINPLMLPDELICVEVLSLLGYAVTLDGVDYF